MLKHKMILAVAAASVIAIPAAARESRLLDDGWTFSLIPDSGSLVQPFTKTVDLPHDWSIELPFDPKASAHNEGGFVTRGKGTYEKKIDLTAKDLADSKYSLLFEGVYERWTLKVNGHEVGFRPYGYSSVIYDVTPYLHAGENTIEVVVDSSHGRSGRWYTGSGIYRHVRLIKTGEVAIAPWSLFISTKEISPSKAVINYSYDVEGSKDVQNYVVDIRIIDPSGAEVVATEKPMNGYKMSVNGTMEIQDPKLWSPDSPSLYTMNVTLKDNGHILDTVSEKFGIRTVSSVSYTHHLAHET